jgi:hypothetical protein
VSYSTNESIDLDGLMEDSILESVEGNDGQYIGEDLDGSFSEEYKSCVSAGIGSGRGP